MSEAIQLIPVEVTVNGEKYLRDIEPRLLLVEFQHDHDVEHQSGSMDAGHAQRRVYPARRRAA